MSKNIKTSQSTKPRKLRELKAQHLASVAGGMPMIDPPMPPIGGPPG